VQQGFAQYREQGDREIQLENGILFVWNIDF